ncbi:Aspartate-semialdehyde dehydrogenase [Escherichia coli IS35]|nr:Aspartate-semialdehyde dehydrogenase [Escherichia coli IS35]
MKNVGFIGWRGMVGSVLMQRMVEERDFDAIRPVFFSTSQLGQLRRLLAEPLAHFRMPLIWRR